MTARMFLAVVPPEEVCEEIEEFLAPRRAVEGLRWSDREAWHVTTAFYARVPEARYEALDELLAEACARTEPFPLAVRGAGAFPDPVTAKALWLGVDDPTGRLAQLAARTRTAGHRAGVPADGATFRPHLTVARGPGRPQGRLVQALDTYAGRTWRVERVDLVESQLGQGPRGTPRYLVAETYDLGSSRSRYGLGEQGGWD
jgi:2'-5' RNA ligase